VDYYDWRKSLHPVFWGTALPEWAASLPRIIRVIEHLVNAAIISAVENVLLPVWREELHDGFEVDVGLTAVHADDLRLAGIDSHQYTMATPEDL
jgi:hypothetical protein